MRGSESVPEFAVISGAEVQAVLNGRHSEIVRIIEDTYRGHGEGATVNPPSCFLHLPDRPSSRIIALPASVGGDMRADGMKWVASYPTNIERGLPRASAIIIVNDYDTGFPLACLEGSIISAARTAASAVLAADALSIGRERPKRVGFFGAGLIARNIHAYLAGTGWRFEALGVHDLSDERAAAFAGHLERTESTGEVTVYKAAEDLVRESDLVVFATVAGAPHVNEPNWFAHNPVVLHISLRDLAPEVILACTNVVDDIDHALRAQTSLHLTEQRAGNRDFVHGAIHDVLADRCRVPIDRPVVFSPFGLGVLDIALARHVYDSMRERRELHTIPGFLQPRRDG